MQQSINQQAQAQAQAQAQQAQAQQRMMNQGNMQSQGPRPTPQPAQQSFSHLQHQMQASPLPGQQPQQQAPMGMAHQGLPPNMTPNQQQQFQMSMQNQQNQGQQNVPGRQGNGQQQMSAQDSALVMDLTNRLMGQASEEEKNTTRASLQSRMDPQQFQKYQSQGLDPLFLYYRNQAMHRLRQEKQSRLAQQAQQLAQQTNIPGGAPMQQQRSMNPSPLTGQTQPPTSMAGNGDFGPFINMENLAAQQQQQGVMAQEAGQMVVPASGAPRNGTPQPGVMPGQTMNMNEQRGVANPNPRVQQQQQMLNAQQVQQQRLQQHAAAQQQQQSQVQARLNAQAKAQALALQGQPGGMGNGPMPPQQSPAMGTLNTPLRTPSQQMNPEPPQVNPNAQFGQPLDPRFMQGNQRPQGQGNGFPPGGLTATMFANIGREQQQRLATLPPDKLNEVVHKWHEQRQLQAGRPQIPMQQVPGQVRPGPQVPQPGQFNPQNGTNQFMVPNPGQQAPQNIAAGMNAQQQLILQQQMNAMRQNPMQQRILQQTTGPNEQRTMAQMDILDIPPVFRGHSSMPQGIPPEVKKWGQLKQWVATTPSLGPDMLETMKGLQRLHYQSMLRNRNQAQGQPGQMQPGAPGGQIGMPTVPPGLAAPVAPMGQNPMQMPTGMNVPLPGLRGPTPQDIMTIRNHPSGKMTGATDEQIRNIFMRNQQTQMQQQQQQMTPQQLQQQQQQALMRMQMQQQRRMNQPNGQQLQQPGQLLQNANNGMPATAVMSAQQLQQNKPQPSAELPNANAPNAARAARPQPAGRSQAQNSSPAGPPKNLKRASSDDVVEIPRPAPQQTQQPKPPNQQARANLSREQVAALDPENRKKYEAMVRAQANQANQANQGANQPTANRAGQPTPEQQAKYRAIQREEEERGKEPLPDIPMDPETKAATEELLKAIVPPMNNVGRVVFRWFMVTLDEGRTRAFFRARLRLAKQFRDGVQMTQLKDTFSVMPKEIESTRHMLNGMVADLSARFPNMKKQEPAKSQPSSTSASQAASQASQSIQAPSVPTPLNAANLQQQQQQLNKIHQRSNSRSSHTPAAPTSAQAPFHFGATSPHGAPSYIGKSTVTQDNLQLPPARKKQKQTAGPGQGTPGSTSSPQVTKAASPDVKRQQVDSKSLLKPSLCCSEPECDRHTIGFDTEEELKRHTQEEHIRPLENPLKYAEENLAAILGLDSHGQPKKAVTSIQDSTKMAASASKQGQTPNVKTETTPAAGTPMNRNGSMNRQSSTANAKSSAQSKAATSKDSPAKPPATQNDSGKQVPQEALAMDSWANATIDPHDLLQSFQPFETGAGGAISDLNVYRSITPNDTPESSKDGVSEPNSDISEGVGLDINVDIFDDNWMPFGPGETDGLFDLNSFNVNSADDFTMFDDDQLIVNLQSWDDMMDQSAFDKPFSFDTSLYSMQAD
jgi:hypothetical protein